MVPIIEDDIRKVVDKMNEKFTFDSSFDESFRANGINYMYGHVLEINNRLLKMTSSPANAPKKYPLLALRLDNPTPINGDMVYYNLNLVIMAFTNENYNAEQRQANVFKPKLYPLYDLFWQSLKAVKIFTWPSNTPGSLLMPEHTKIDRYYWGTYTANKNTKNIFGDPLDAIEIVDLKINSRIKCL